jgi:hypothetical protein
VPQLAGLARARLDRARRPLRPDASTNTVSFVLVSPSTLSWSQVRAAAGRRSPWRTAGSTVASVRTIASIVAIRGWIMPDALGDAGDPDATRREAVGIGQRDRHGRGLRPRVGRAERLRGRGQRVVGRGEARGERVDAGGDLVERQPRSDDPGREEQRPLVVDPQRAGEEPGDLGLVGVAGGPGRGVGEPLVETIASASPNAPLRPPEVCFRCSRESRTGAAAKGVRGEDAAALAGPAPGSVATIARSDGRTP